MILSDYAPPGIIVEISDLKTPKAIALANALAGGKIEYSELVECRTLESGDVIIFEVEVEVSQLRKHPIESVEKLAALFNIADIQTPEVISLRRDFPLVPHLNLRPEGYPKSLCLYDQAYADIKPRWTAARFIARVREWLALTVKGKLHQEDQPLEPLISVSSSQIVLPHSLLDSDTEEIPEKLFITASGDIDNSLFLITYKDKPEGLKSLEVITSIFCCAPQEHGIIRHQPRNLDQVARLTGDRTAFFDELEKRLLSWRDKNTAENNFLNSRLVLIIIFPKLRQEGTQAENNEILAFITDSYVKDIGLKLGLWELRDGHYCQIFGGDVQKTGESINIEVLNPRFELTRNLAAIQNGRADTKEKQIVAVGVGALGSQTVMNLARSGFGKWTLIDEDRLLPHNLARHALFNHHIGWEKAFATAFEANNLIRDESLFTHLVADILTPGKKKEKVKNAFGQADVILDMTASVSAARHIAINVESDARRISFFLSPTGNDSIILAEDNNREQKLDELEMQYYRAILNHEDLGQHLQPAEGKRHYGRSCRDITSTLSQELTALHSAIGSRIFRQVCASEDAQLAIWKTDNSGNVKRINIDTAKTIRHSIGSWTVCTDVQFLDKLHKIREAKSPNETGGVLVGSFDLNNRIVYIVDTVPSPPDSEEWPTLYIRGCQGLKKELDNIYEMTSGMLEYIGEWHSHPEMSPTSPSDDDLEVFAWLTDLMDSDGLPALMMIVGQKGNASCYVGEIYKEENRLPRAE